MKLPRDLIEFCGLMLAMAGIVGCGSEASDRPAGKLIYGFTATLNYHGTAVAIPPGQMPRVEMTHLGVGQAGSTGTYGFDVQLDGAVTGIDERGHIQEVMKWMPVGKYFCTLYRKNLRIDGWPARSNFAFEIKEGQTAYAIEMGESFDMPN